MHAIRSILLALALPVALLACAVPTMSKAPSERAMARVQPGMSTAEVEQLLGRPDGGTATYLSGETVSGWRVPLARGGATAAYFNVHYRDGKVVRTSRSFEYNVP